MTHPCQWSPEVLDIIETLIRFGDHIFDPFAGTGHRLAALADRLGVTYAGADIEDWPGHDPRVTIADSTLASTYPDPPFTVVTSPVYLNKRLADYPNGPLPTTKTKGRRDYGIALGRALHTNNLARHTGHQSRAEKYWFAHADAVKHWGARAIVNVDAPIGDGWADLLELSGYWVIRMFEVRTQRYGGLHNAEKRADHEVVIVGVRA